MSKKIGEMSVAGLKTISKIFLESDNVLEHKLERFRLDIYFPDDRIAIEYDGPDHYDKVANHERDERKNALCKSEGITLMRWPYYFQLTRDIARYYFPKQYSDNKYELAIMAVYGTNIESEILAPGLHKSKFTPANFTSKGIKRFIAEMKDAPESLRSQVKQSFKLYEQQIVKKHGEGFEWLLYPEDNAKFDEFMKFDPDPKYLNYIYTNSKI
jgi:hypothetical protein